MSTAVPCYESTLCSLRVYWRTHDEFGLIPRPAQTWWAACYDADGLLVAMPVDQDLIDQSNDLAELVVLIAERLDCTIGIEQVKVDTGHRTAEWNNNVS